MKKSMKVLTAAPAAVGIFMSVGWSFFELMVHCRSKRNQTKKKWFGLSHIRINHPRNKFEKEYEEDLGIEFVFDGIDVNTAGEYDLAIKLKNPDYKARSISSGNVFSSGR